MKDQIDKNPVVIREEEVKSTVEREGADSELTGRARSLANLTGKGRKPGQPNKITKTIRDAVMAAVQPGACHENGFEGWLIERSKGGIEDRKIFAGVVSRVIPVEITGAGGGPIKIDLGWMTDRRLVSGDVIDVTPTTQSPANPVLAGGATDVISDDPSKSESEA